MGDTTHDGGRYGRRNRNASGRANPNDVLSELKYDARVLPRRDRRRVKDGVVTEDLDVVDAEVVDADGRK
jgi:hypothetical protein